MYAFKGELAKILAKYMVGSGQQLQHSLGNLYSQNKICELVDQWNLEAIVLKGDNADFEKLKHIFGYALMVYLYINLDSI